MAVSISIAIAQNSQSIVNNTSNVTVSVNLNWDSGSWNAEYPAPPGWLEIDGVTYDFRSTFNENRVSSGSKTLFTQTVDVKHGSNGAKTLSCSASFDSGTGSGTVTATETKTLTTIARASSFTVTCDDLNFPLGTAAKFSISRKDSSFTHTVTYECGSTSGTIKTKTTSTSFSWTMPLSLAKQNKTGTSVNVTFKVTTYSGSTAIGDTAIKTVTCYIPDNVAPTVSFSVNDTSGCFSKYGAYVQSKSALTVSIDADGSQDSYIKSWNTSFDGKTHSTSGFNVSSINGKGDLTMTVTVTDSRGRKATAKKTLTVLAYSAPKISSLSVKRSSNGSSLIATFSASVTSLNGKNKLVYATEYKKNTASSYGNKEEVTASGASISSIKRTFTADTASTYDVRLTVTDDFGSVQKTAVGSSVKKLWSIFEKGTGFAFGKIASRQNALDMGWPIYMNSNKITELATPTSDTDAATKAYADGMKDKTFTCGTYNGDYDEAPLGTWWTMPAGGTCTNFPEDATVKATYGFLSTVKANTQLSQTYTQFASGITWFRSRVRNDSVDTWSSWFRTDGIAGVKMDLLWKNGSTSSSFAAQTISLDLSKYDYVAVVAFRYAGNVRRFPVLLCQNPSTTGGLMCGFNLSTGNYAGRTLNSVDANGLAFGGGHTANTVGTGTADDKACIPYLIFGIKGVAG